MVTKCVLLTLSYVYILYNFLMCDVKGTVDSNRTKTSLISFCFMHFPHSHPYIYIYNIVTSFLSLFDVILESTLLNYANPCRNWTFQRFARVAEKKERDGTNEKCDTR